MSDSSQKSLHHVVIVGGGFGGLYAAKELRKAPVKITLVDKRNFHLFQPLLYQVATGGLSPGDIASPLRTILKKQANAGVVQDEVMDVDPGAKELILDKRQIDLRLVDLCDRRLQSLLWPYRLGDSSSWPENNRRCH